MFRIAAQNRIFQDVVNQIQEAVLDGRLKVGDVLPPERDLKAMFNTSRGTLREALRVLEERGLIEIKLGVHGGAMVKGVSADQATQTLARMIRSQQVALHHLAEFREGVEGNVAYLAARHATQGDADLLKELVEEGRRCIDASVDRDGFIDVDRRFHQELARISGNPVYIFVMETVHTNIHRYYDRYLSMQQAELEENLRDLDEITRAVAAGRADEARLLSQGHVLRFNRRMTERQARDRLKHGNKPPAEQKAGILYKDGEMGK